MLEPPAALKLYTFDGIGPDLDLIPLAARRALDAIGYKLSLKSYQTLPVIQREALARSGSGRAIDVEAAKQVAELADPDCPRIPAVDPDAIEYAQVEAALGPERPLSLKVWETLSPLDRYALAKVCAKGRPDRMSGAYEEIVGATQVSTHLRPQGGVVMVSVAEKPATQRSALAECLVTMSPEAFSKLMRHEGPKGDVLGTARLAGIMATKKTSDLIPLCHPLALQHAEVDFEPLPGKAQLRITCRAIVFAPTGVEMEAMTGAMTAALTVYDMLKSVDRGMSIGPLRLLEKSGGRSGNFQQHAAGTASAAGAPSEDEA